MIPFDTHRPIASIKMSKNPRNQSEEMEISPEDQNSPSQNSQIQVTDNTLPNQQQTIQNKADNSGLLRYFSVVTTNKRKRGHNGNDANNSQTIPVSNKFAPLSSISDNEPKQYRPPPIYLRERSSIGLEKEIKPLINNEYYIVDLKRGKLQETKIQVANEVDYTKLTNWLDQHKKNTIPIS